MSKAQHSQSDAFKHATGRSAQGLLSQEGHKELVQHESYKLLCWPSTQLKGVAAFYYPEVLILFVGSELVCSFMIGRKYRQKLCQLDHGLSEKI